MTDPHFSKGYLVKCHQYFSGGYVHNSLTDTEIVSQLGQPRGPTEFDATVILFDLHPICWAAWPPYGYYLNYGYTIVDHWIEIDNPSAVYGGIIDAPPTHMRIITLDEYIQNFDAAVSAATDEAEKNYCVNAVMMLHKYRTIVQGI
ncbi:MAG TPA: hypothetical protein VNX68_12085 [Nitrosopumilaceae archaeon]|jgi:hypothetical protein|nr:hypothetical protein [Nitrosopumilaceae archaeon]